MLKTLLVAMDDSTSGRSALELGLDWARRRDALLVGLATTEPPGAAHPEAVPLGAGQFKQDRDETMRVRAAKRAEELLSRAAQQAAARGVSFKPLEAVALACDGLIADAQRYDLILIGRETCDAFERQAGRRGNLRHLVHATPRPIVVVPPAPLRQGSTVICYDGSQQAARTLAAFVSTTPPPIDGVHVVTMHADHVAGARCADHAIEFLAFHEIAAKAHVVAPQGAAGVTLLDESRRLDAALLVMGAYGQSAVKEFVIGSVTQTVIDESTVPVYLFH